MLGDFRGREGDIVTGVVQQSQGRGVLVDFGSVEGMMPTAEQVSFRGVLGVRPARSPPRRCASTALTTA